MAELNERLLLRARELCTSLEPLDAPAERSRTHHQLIELLTHGLDLRDEQHCRHLALDAEIVDQRVRVIERLLELVKQLALVQGLLSRGTAAALLAMRSRTFRSRRGGLL